MVRHRALDFLSWSCPSEAPESLHGLIVIEPEPIEPAFHLMEVIERPLVATINFQDPEDAAVRNIVALADRCFAASYFRFHQLV